MKSIIVTISDKNKRFMLDMEVPTDEPGRKVTEDVFEVLNHKDEELHLNSYYHCLYLNRQKKALGVRETLAEAGVWNGDYITIISRM